MGLMSTDTALEVIRQQVDNYFDKRPGFTEDFDGQALIRAFCDLDWSLSNGCSIPTEWS